MTYKLMKLPYQYGELEPYIDEKTVEIHYSRHHQTYVDKLNKALEDENIEWISIEDILINSSKYSSAIINNAWQVYNHDFYWNSLCPSLKSKIDEDILKKIENNFWSLENFKLEFENTAISQFWSWWAWLIKTNEWKLKITKTSNHISPIMDISDEKWTPLMCVDVWEHAYYLKYQNKRPEYLSNFWNIINWDFVKENLNK